MIYIIAAAGSPFVKIGKSRGIGRLDDLQVGCPYQLAYLAIADWPDSDEKKIHRVLRHSRERGEWYRRGVDVDRLINHMHSGLSFDAWLNERTPKRLARILKFAR